MAVSSTIWIIVIAVGAVLVAIGNINFNLARDREKGEAAGYKALSILRTEFAFNLDRVQELRKAIQSGRVTTDGFQSTAWNVVSNGGLLVQMDQRTLAEITDAYYLIKLADKYRSEILDMSVGVRSALGGISATRQQYSTMLSATLDKFEPKLKSISERIQ